MANIKAFCRAIKEKIQARSRRRRMFADTMFLIRLQQMDASVHAYIRELEAKVGVQARQIREMGAQIQNLRLVAIDADLNGESRRYVRLPYQVTRVAKQPPFKTILAIGVLLTGCVFSAPEHDPLVDTQTLTPGERSACRPSCALVWKYVQKSPLNPGDSIYFADAVGDTLVAYKGYTEDGRDVYLSRDVYDTLDVGETIPGCSLDRKAACAE